MNKNWYDLSHLYTEGMPEAAGHAPFHAERVINPNTGSRISNITLNSHCGTHIDAPYHFVPDGKTIDLFPPSYFVGIAYILDAPKNPLESVTSEDLLKYETEIEKSDFLFIRTGWESRWGKLDYTWAYPFITEDAARYILKNKIRIIGTDTVSPDPSVKSGLRKGSPVHSLLLSKNVLIIENLTGMEPIKGKMVMAYCFPLAFKDGDGSPTRVVAHDL